MKMQMRLTVAGLWLAGCAAAMAQIGPPTIFLWPNGAPGSEGKADIPEGARVTPQGDHVLSAIHRPAIIPYGPMHDTGTGAAVVIIPGGGHSELWIDHEGHNVAKWLAAHGVTAFVLKYRLAREKGSTYTVEGTALADTQRAIRLIRSQAAGYHIDPNRIGVMGFSAGGELAALAGTRYDDGQPDAPDPIDRLSSRPLFQALIYPAIPRDMKLTKDTPPAFMACGEQDRQNISQGLPELYLAFKKAGISAELHVYAGVGHGFGVRDTTQGEVATWTSSFYQWMADHKWLQPR